MMNQETGETFLPPYIIKEVNGESIGFIGVVTTETTNFLLPEGIEQLEFTDELVAINKAAKELKKKMYNQSLSLHIIQYRLRKMDANSIWCDCRFCRKSR